MTAAHYKGGHLPGNDLGLHYTALPPIVASCPHSDQLLVTRKFWSPGANRPSQARSAPLVVEAAPEEASPIRGWPTRARGDFCQFLNEKRADRGADWFRLRPL